MQHLSRQIISKLYFRNHLIFKILTPHQHTREVDANNIYQQDNVLKRQPNNIPIKSR